MKNYLVLGSCRVCEPFLKENSFKLYPGGHVHSTSEVLQAIRIMRGETITPPECEDYFYRGWGYKEDKIVKFKTFLYS